VHFHTVKGRTTNRHLLHRLKLFACLPVCHIRRSSRHKTFDAVAEYGHTSVGWFFGLKLHLVINNRGELIAFKITRGSRHDSKEAVPMLRKLKGLAFGDKGYLGKKSFRNSFPGV
jgi:hypothetical protein